MYSNQHVDKHLFSHFMLGENNTNQRSKRIQKTLTNKQISIFNLTGNDDCNKQETITQNFKASIFSRISDEKNSWTAQKWPLMAISHGTNGTNKSTQELFQILRKNHLGTVSPIQVQKLVCVHNSCVQLWNPAKS